MSTLNLTQTSYAVLGLVEALQPTTPYEMKRFGQAGFFMFWSIPHTQIYTECARMSEAGYLNEKREQKGRRRRLLSLTEMGKRALDAWREDPDTETFEVRDEGLLKLYFGTDRVELAKNQVESHGMRLQFLEAVHEGAEMSEGMRAVFEAATTLERAFVRFWTELRDRSEPKGR